MSLVDTHELNLEHQRRTAGNLGAGAARAVALAGGNDELALLANALRTAPGERLGCVRACGSTRDWGELTIPATPSSQPAKVGRGEA